VLLHLIVALLLVVAFLGAEAANTFDFALRYRGNSPDGRVFSMKGGSQMITTTITPKDAITFKIQELVGSFSTIRADTTVFQNKTFVSTGNVTFGTHQFQDTHALLFKTVGLGYETKSPATNEVAVSAVWEVFSGKGVFNNAFGTLAVSCNVKVAKVDNLECFVVGIIFA